MKNSIYLLLFIYAIAATLTIIFFDGTGDAGDSIYHYLYARYAPLHPELFFNHWAKPVYVLLACPFAQFGFAGIKVFNAIASLLAIFFTYKIAVGLNLKNAIVSAVMMMFAPLYYELTFSGLTEPLFALFVAAGTFLVIKRKYLSAALVISFLPFVRSEGLILIGVFCIYFLIKRQWKLIPVLFCGHLIYSVAGYFIHHDFLWVFNEIPYAQLDSSYGNGGLMTFIYHLFYLTGVPVYILFWIGYVIIIRGIIKRKIIAEEWVLVFLGFTCFFIAHTLFWYFGIFHSMGLKRVLIGVMPLVAIISLQGFNFLTEEVFGKNRKVRMVFAGLLVVYIIVFPFTDNPAAIDWKTDMGLNKDQQSAIKLADFIFDRVGAGHRIVTAHPYLCEVLHVDPFDKNKRLELTPNSMSQLKTGDIIIWENWFAAVESGVNKEDLDTNWDLVNLYNSKENGAHREILYSVYERK